MTLYRKKPIEVEARLFARLANGWTNGEELARWCGGDLHVEAKPSDPTDVAVWLDIPTLEGVMCANVGDWIIHGVEGEFYPCKPSVFDATYEAVE